MKNRYITLYIFGLMAFIIILVAILVCEVYFFKQHVHQLVALKEDYENYKQGLRRVIAERQNTCTDNNLKKKILINDMAFNPVNRDVLYLQDSARTYIHSKGLQDLDYEKLYEFTSTKKSTSRNKRRANRIALNPPRALPMDREALAIIREHSLILPIDRHLFRISSRFGPRKRRDGSWGFHYGLDMAAPYLTRVSAIASGVIIEAGPAKGFGNTVVIAHSNKLKTRYAHLARYHVKVGDTVDQGQLIGLVGNTGNVRGRNGVHLHIELLLYGKRIDPWHIFNELRSI